LNIQSLQLKQNPPKEVGGCSKTVHR